MTIHSRAWTPLLAGATGALLAVALFSLSPVRAQVPGPPMTLYGSISDSAGPIPVDTPVEMYVGDTLCGKTKVFYAGEGDAAVALYVGDVVGDEQTKGCGKDDIDVRVKVGDRFADQKAKWRAGLTKLDITFGTATPAPIPTTTPTPTPAGGATAPSAQTQTPGNEGETPTAVATSADGSPIASPSGSASPAGTATRTPPGGGVVSSNDNAPGGGDDGGGDGFPVWAAVVLALGGVAVIGGGIGFMMARNRRAVPDEDETTLV